MPRIIKEEESDHDSSESDYILLSQFDLPDGGNVFAVSTEQPMFKHLQLYGVDGESHYFWNCLGQMGENLHEGCKPAIEEAMDAGEHVYVFNSPEDVLSDIESSQGSNSSEIVSLYGCAMTLYEHHHGSESIEFGRVCWANAEFLKIIGKDKAFRDYGGMALEIVKEHLSDEHPEVVAMQKDLKPQLELF